MVAADEVHQAEVQRLDAGQGGDVLHLAQRAVGLDQHMGGDLPRQAAVLGDGGERHQHGLRVLPSADLGKGDVGELLAGRADDDLQVVAPVRVGDVVDARADAAVAVVGAKSMASATISAWAFSAPAGAPSSQSQVTSKIGPRACCRASALPISFSLPA